MRDDKCCERYEELLPQLIDGELEGDRASEVRSHVDRCPSCRESLEALVRLDRELGRLPSLAPDGTAVAAAVTGRLGLRRRSRTAALIGMLPIERLAPPLGVLAILIATSRFTGGAVEGMTGLLTGWLAGLAETFNDLAVSQAAIDPFVVYVSGALMLIACAAISLAALRIVRR